MIEAVTRYCNIKAFVETSQLNVKKLMVYWTFMSMMGTLP